MPQFHVYSTEVCEVVAARIMNSTDFNPGCTADSNPDCKERLDVDSTNNRRGKYSYYLKNCVVYVISAILQYSVANGTLNLLTSLAGEEKGFATLVVVYISSYMAVFAPGLIKSLGCKAVIVIVNAGYLIFSIGNIKVEYYTLIPAAIFGGYSVGTVWVCGATYLNILGVGYAQHHKTTANKMISYTNGISMFCFSSGTLIGNAVSSLLLLPTRENDANSTEECSMEPENLAENKFVYILRSVIILMGIVSLILSLFFLDAPKEEKIERFKVMNLLTNTKDSLIEYVKALCRPNIGLVTPIMIAGGIGIAFLPGIFARVSMYKILTTHIYIYLVCMHACTHDNYKTAWEEFDDEITEFKLHHFCREIL